MRLACWLLAIGAISNAADPLTARTGVPLDTNRTGHSLILNDVFINGDGPFRMLVDSGNATSVVRPRVARRLNLKTAYFIEQATVADTRRVPATILEQVRATSVIDRSVEAIIGDVFQPGVDGILGANWLVRHDYLLDYRNERIVLDGEPALFGVRVPLRSGDGRPVVVASIDGRSRELVVDAGASAIVLFEKPTDGKDVARLNANGASTRALRFMARFSLSGDGEHLMEAVRVDVRGLGQGLLPTSAFRSVFISNREGFVEFAR